MEIKFLKNELDRLASRFNTTDFIAGDPVQFPLRYNRKEDIEIVSLLVSHISWGNRKMILRSAEKLLSRLGDSPVEYVLKGDFSNISPDENIHRTFFGRDLIYFLRGLHEVYTRFGSLEEFGRSLGIQNSPYPAWQLAAGLNTMMKDAAGDGYVSNRCIPANLEATALKRLNMALRWLVRNDGIVDLGVWTLLTPAQLFIPLDVHVGNIGREMGIITRKANDRRTAEELTAFLRTLSPDDPIKYDFALFGFGVNGKNE